MGLKGFNMPWEPWSNSISLRFQSPVPWTTTLITTVGPQSFPHPGSWLLLTVLRLSILVNQSIKMRLSILVTLNQSKWDCLYWWIIQSKWDCLYWWINQSKWDCWYWWHSINQNEIVYIGESITQNEIVNIGDTQSLFRLWIYYCIKIGLSSYNRRQSHVIYNW